MGLSSTISSWDVTQLRLSLPDEFPMNGLLVTEITRRAMATEFGVVLPGQDRAAIEVAVDALDDLGRLESLMSIYQPASQISEVNRMAGIRPVRVETELIEVLVRGQAIWQLTNGAFDVTAGPLVRCWGFNQRRGKKPATEEIEIARSLVGSERLQIDPAGQSVYLVDRSMEINLGGIGKGFALDSIAARLLAQGVENFLIHGGRSTVVARGSDQADRDLGWGVGIEHPLRPGMRLGQIRLREQALATSGSGKQFFHVNGKRLGHVLDPRTGYPAGDMLSISVISDSGMDADALSTACFVEGLATVRERIGRRELPTGSPTPASPSWPSQGIAVVPDNRADGVITHCLGAYEQLDWTPADPPQ